MLLIRHTRKRVGWCCLLDLGIMVRLLIKLNIEAKNNLEEAKELEINLKVVTNKAVKATL